MSDHDERERFVLYRLCECPECGGTGKAGLVGDYTSAGGAAIVKCAECRGEGRIRQEVASCETAEAVGVALVTLGREHEWDGCAFGLLDRTPECDECGGGYPENLDCTGCQGSGVKSTGTWLLLPWMPSARNVTDAARTLARSKKRAGSS